MTIDNGFKSLSAFCDVKSAEIPFRLHQFLVGLLNALVRIFNVNYVALSDSCNRLAAASGTISNEKSDYRYSKCWKIIVPSNSYVQLSMDSFYSSSGGCSYTKVEVSIANRDEKFTFCPGESNWQPVIAFDDITVTHEMNYHSYFTSSFSMRYRGENFMCAQKNIFKCYSGACIPQSQVCDGIKHCYNGDDEKGCETGVFAVPGVDRSRLNGTRWLKEKWSPSSGWQENTHRAIIAWHLATERNSTGVDVEGKLMVKQLEVQTLAAILRYMHNRNQTDPLTANQLSMFVNALTVACQDPYNFYGYDLVKMLKDKVDISSLTAQPVSYLALCNAGETLPVNATSVLTKVLNSDSEYPFLLDVQAAAVMAFSCVRANQQNGSNSSFIDTDYQEAVARFKQLQLDDGSFGNIYTTAIVTQALLSAGEENSKDWKLKAAVSHLMKHLNSSSVDFLATYLILPVLNGKSLSDIRSSDCSDGLQHKSQGDSVPEVKSKLGPKMRVQYSLYIGDEKDIVHTLSLRVPENITVFDIMQLAEEADSKYKFQWKQMGQKVYIYDVAGIINDFEDGLFWLLYVGKDVDSITHNTESPDKVTVNDGAQIIMWYKKATI
ncbi:Uncharacterized protein CG3556 [Araneus ventricosus]|uniref:Uncharacterized protein CG3556 n=1 Tax=Araneus ventricosus TaxID=182803 RepID=A0A4Y2EC32_ARAVE|nr:Uncharacterized protein CG3556 [Araneus ventricosus]